MIKTIFKLSEHGSDFLFPYSIGNGLKIPEINFRSKKHDSVLQKLINDIMNNVIGNLADGSFTILPNETNITKCNNNLLSKTYNDDGTINKIPLKTNDEKNNQVKDIESSILSLIEEYMKLNPQYDDDSDWDDDSDDTDTIDDIIDDLDDIIYEVEDCVDADTLNKFKDASNDVIEKLKSNKK